MKVDKTMLMAVCAACLLTGIAAERRMDYPDHVRRWPQLKGVMLGASTEKEFQDLHAMGATLVRYQMHGQWSQFTNATDDVAAFNVWMDKRLDHLAEMLPWARKYGIKICVDQHTHIGGLTKEKYNSDMIFVEKKYEDALVANWEKIARRFKGNLDVIYGYDLFNEPINRENALIKRSWHDVFCRVIEAIRAIDPDTPIIVEPNCNASPRGFDIKNPYGLKGVDLLPYDNLIYTVHVYQPMAFTHQGLFQRRENYRPLAYPSANAKADPNRTRYPGDLGKDTGKSEVWDKEFVRKEIQSVRDFQLRHGVRIFVGEFSAAAYAPGGDEYVNDLCDLFREYGWDWTYHAFRESTCWSFEHEGASFYELKPAKKKTRRQEILEKYMRDNRIQGDVTVDFTQPCGELKRLNGVINTIRLTQYANPRIRAEYAALEPPYVRFHDAALANPGAAVMDISRIFPLFHLDENDARNYDFRPTDDLLALTRGFCTEIEFKIGESIEHYEHRYRVNPPSDRAKYARICLNIIRHYNEGWAGGFRWNIRRWSVWEEPDNTKLFNGDFQKEFFPLYAEIARAIKGKYPDLEVGGCATRGREMFRAEQFVSYCREQKLPLDFCSITDYRRTLEPMFAVGDELRRILDTNGFTRTTIDLSEWHYEPANWTPAPGRDSAEVYRELTGVNGGAFTAAMLLRGQDSVYDRMCYYHATGDGGFWGLRGGAGDGRVNSHWYALKAFADLARLRHRVKTSAPRARGFAAAATRAEDGRAALMVAAFRPTDTEPIRVFVKGAERPTEVLLEDGEAHRLSACDGWTFADGTLTLPNTGRSAVWLVTFGGYKALRLAHLEVGKTVRKTDWKRSDFVGGDGRPAFAFVVPREMIVRDSPLIEQARALAKRAFGAVPEVYGDDDNEKISQSPVLIALGMVGSVRHPKLLSLQCADDEESYVRLEAFFRQLK